jgi:hypothetical protein
MRFGRFRASALSLGLAVMLGVMSVVPTLAASSSTVTVTPASLSATSWYFFNDTNDAASVTEDSAHYKFVPGPGAPPAGVGSVFFHDDPEPLVPVNAQQRWNIATSMFGGTPLASLTALKFNTFQPSTGQGTSCSNVNNECAVYLNFDVDFGAGVCPPVTCASASGYQRRLVYVPSVNGTVAFDTWQEWDTTSTGAQWTWSGYGDNGSKWPDENTSQYRTWAQIKTAFPGARINNGATSSQLLFRAGEPYGGTPGAPGGFTGYLDKATIGVSGNTVVYDFEPFLTAQNKDDCKNGGWQTLRRADGSSFKNQGDCVSYANNGK